MAAAGTIADHCHPRHRAWVIDAARLYFCSPDDLPPDLRERVGSGGSVVEGVVLEGSRRRQWRATSAWRMRSLMRHRAR